MPRQYPQTPQHHKVTTAASHDSDASYEGDNQIYTARRTKSSHDLRSVQQTPSIARTANLRVLLGQGLGLRKPKSAQITTAPGQLGAGETETEADEPPKHLPTSRIRPASEPLLPPSAFMTLLFEASRLLSVVPALVGASVNAWCLWSPPGHTPVIYDRYHNMALCTDIWGRRTLPDRGDYCLAVLWALLTAHQCLKLTTGLLHRWKAYYQPLSTLIRLLALQAICWPATHFTLNIVGSWGSNYILLDDGSLSTLEVTLLRWTTIRPDVCWAIIGTTTCFSRSIQIWVTSNLLPLPRTFSGFSIIPGVVPDHLWPKAKKTTGEEVRKSSGRRWNWGIVARVCMLPAGVLYLLMAWIGVWRREVGSCY
ncbi:hypothetical protein J3A83DRAFT_4203577 [Scleroderma citrinum]